MRPAAETAPLDDVALADWRATGLAYLALAKPRIIELLLVTTIPAMFLAAGGFPEWQLVVWTLLGGTAAAGSANVFNSVLDADIDARMRRTRRRPMARDLVSPAKAIAFGAVLGVLATVILGFGANWLSAALALVANLYYVFVYTMALKRRTSQNIVWGGIAGCFPPLIGWTAVTAPVAVAWRILAYSVLTVAVSLLLWPVANTGWLYPVVALVAGLAMLAEAVALLVRAKRGLVDAELKPMRLFHLSNSYLAIVFIAAAIDPLLF